MAWSRRSSTMFSGRQETSLSVSVDIEEPEDSCKCEIECVHDKNNGKRTDIKQFDSFEDERLWQMFVSARDNKDFKNWQMLRNYLFKKYDRYRKSIYKSSFRKLPYCPSVDMDDFDSQSCIGMLEAIDSFDLSYGVRFEVFARARISGSLIDLLRKTQNFPRDIAPLKRCMNAAVADIRQRKQREPTPDDIVDELGDGYSPLTEPLLYSQVFNNFKHTESCNGGDDCDRESNKIALNEVESSNMKGITNNTNRSREKLEGERRLERIVLLQLPDPEKTVIYQSFFCGEKDSAIRQMIYPTPSMSKISRIRQRGLDMLGPKVQEMMEESE